MVQLLYMVIPMFRCWNVLLPIKMMAHYEAKLASLEKRAMCQLRIDAAQNPGRITSITGADESNVASSA
jgi:hypothetical protein